MSAQNRVQEPGTAPTAIAMQLPDAMIGHILSFSVFAEPSETIVLRRSAHSCEDCDDQTSAGGAPTLVRSRLPDFLFACELVCKQWCRVVRDPEGSCAELWARACAYDLPRMLAPSRLNYIRWRHLGVQFPAVVQPTLSTAGTIAHKPRLEQFVVAMHFKQPRSVGDGAGTAYGSAGDDMRSVLSFEHGLAFCFEEDMGYLHFVSNASRQRGVLIDHLCSSSIIISEDVRGTACDTQGDRDLHQYCAMACDVTLLGPDGRIARLGVADFCDDHAIGDSSFDTMTSEGDEVTTYIAGARLGPRMRICGHALAFRVGIGVTAYESGPAVSGAVSIAGPIADVTFFLEAASPYMYEVAQSMEDYKQAEQAWENTLEFLRHLTDEHVVDILLQSLTWN
jgi:hypothetical protein